MYFVTVTDTEGKTVKVNPHAVIMYASMNDGEVTRLRLMDGSNLYVQQPTLEVDALIDRAL